MIIMIISVISIIIGIIIIIIIIISSSSNSSISTRTRTSIVINSIATAPEPYGALHKVDVGHGRSNFPTGGTTA